MDTRRTTRNVAGMNTTLSADYVWPEKFGRGERKTGKCTEAEKAKSVQEGGTALSRSNVNLQIVNEKTNGRNDGKSDRTGASSMKSVLAKKILELEMERKIQEMEMDLKRKEIADKKKILEIEHEIQVVQLEARSNSTRLSEDVCEATHNRHHKEDFVADWVNRLEFNNAEENMSVTSTHEFMYVNKENRNDEIKQLCETISNALKATINNNSQDKLLARQIVAKDFPYFDGNPESWPIFYKHFQNICSVCEYSNEEIVLKLQKCLKGEAKAVVAGMLLVGDNVDQIIDVLKMRFGRPELILDTLIAKIRNIPNIRDTHLERLIKFSGEVNNLVCTIKTLKIKSHLENPQLLREMVSKIPDNLKLQWGGIIVRNEDAEEELNLEDFSHWLKKIAHAACFVSTPKQNYTQRLHEFKKADRVFSTKEEKTQFCYYCENEHYHRCPQMEVDDLDQRWKTVTDKKLCFSCLRKNHQQSKCRRKKTCGLNGCKSSHHNLLHNDLQDTRHYGTTNQEEPKQVYTLRNKMKKQVLLRMIPVKLHGPNKTVTVLALCDEGSTVTLLDKKVAEDLSLPGTREPLCIQWTNEETQTQEDSLRVELNISKVSDEKMLKLKAVRTIENLKLPAQTIKMEDWRKYPHLRDVSIQDIINEKPVMLIGQDNIDLIVTRQIRSGADHLPVATKCKLGWSLHGSCCLGQNKTRFKAHTLHICEKTDDIDLETLIKSSYSTESFGVLIIVNEICKEDARALKIMKNTSKRIGTRYEIGLLWRTDEIQLPKNYINKITEYLEKGYVRKLSHEDAKVETSRTWYLPHFGVQNPNKPGKLRLVFDAAAKSNGNSLNDYLLSGPDLLQSLVAILWKFRQRQIGFCGDVKEMFHQVVIRESDRSAQRFLWRDLQNREPDVYEMVVMTFGATCSPVCAQYIKNLNAQEATEDEEIKNAIIKKFYVDDYLDSKDNVEDALETINKIRRVMKHGGYEVVNWMCNSSKIREKLSEENLLITTKNIDDSNLHRVLGLWWDSEKDEFQFKLNEDKYIGGKPTKRKVLQAVMSLFDPLGLIAFFTIRGKILMQDLWRTKLDWDDTLPESIERDWTKWKNDLKKIADIRIPRCYSTTIPEAEQIEIHTFCDSSEKAFCAVSFLRVVSGGHINVMIIAGKTRVAPLKPLSIPRLELQAAVMASRLSESINQELELRINRNYFWTDSQCVLHWIRGDGRKYKQFVAHRIGELQERTNVEDWNWVPTKWNIADDGTRAESDRSNSSQTISKQWFCGPDFLKLQEECWPKEKENCNKHGEEEFKNEYTFLTTEYNTSLPNIKCFSKFTRLLRTTAWCLRFIKKSQKQKCSLELSVEELNNAEQLWIKEVQGYYFKEELYCLTHERPLNKKSRLISLNPEIQYGMLVVGGRTKLSRHMEEQAKQPLILTPEHDFTKLLISNFHEKYNHRGVETILNELRQKYWIINARPAVKAAFKRCYQCKREFSKPEIPIMGQLPEPRVNRQIRPFVEIGMDNFGPFYVSIGRRKEKRWGAIFTCLSTRAIHLEIVHSLSTDSAIMAIIRMAARRGPPKTIYCDNGTNFVGAANELKKASEELGKKFQNNLSGKGINFKFNPPSTPHMGGAWERLIGSVKRTIGKILWDQSVKEETLNTFFVQAENIVNSRPLTKVSTDPEDLESLTPNHFLLGNSNGDGMNVYVDPSAKVFRKEWKRLQMLKETFWNRWSREYLPTLNKRNKWNLDNKPIQIGDVVVMMEDNVAKHAWKLGRVTALHPGRDERIRVVDLKTASNEYRRPVSKICRLQLEED